MYYPCFTVKDRSLLLFKIFNFFIHVRMDLKLKKKHIQKPHSDQALKSSHAYVVCNAVFLVTPCLLVFSFVYNIFKYICYLLKSMFHSVVWA